MSAFVTCNSKTVPHLVIYHTVTKSFFLKKNKKIAHYEEKHFGYVEVMNIRKSKVRILV